MQLGKRYAGTARKALLSQHRQSKVIVFDFNQHIIRRIQKRAGDVSGYHEGFNNSTEITDRIIWKAWLFGRETLFGAEAFDVPVESNLSFRFVHSTQPQGSLSISLGRDHAVVSMVGKPFMMPDGSPLLTSMQCS